MGVADATLGGNHHLPPHCMPDHVTGDELRGVFGKYAHQHPQDRDMFASDLVEYALADAFPCPQKLSVIFKPHGEGQTDEVLPSRR